MARNDSYRIINVVIVDVSHAADYGYECIVDERTGFYRQFRKSDNLTGSKANVFVIFIFIYYIYILYICEDFF